MCIRDRCSVSVPLLLCSQHVVDKTAVLFVSSDWGGQADRVVTLTRSNDAAQPLPLVVANETAVLALFTLTSYIMQLINFLQIVNLKNDEAAVPFFLAAATSWGYL